MSKTPAKKNLIAIDSQDDADRALQRLGDLGRAIGAEESRVNGEINKLRQDLVDYTANDRALVAEIEAALEAWAETKKYMLFKEPRSIDLNWGRIGFRWTPWKIKFLGKLKVETVVEKLRAAKMRHLIRVEESVDKEKALNYDNETLVPLGMKKTHVDEFWYELKKEEVK